MIRANSEDLRSVFNIQSSQVLKFLDTDDAVTQDAVYNHQKEAVKEVKKQLDDDSKSNIALVVLPTGCGKTGVAVLAAFALDAKQVLVVTPSTTISDQILKAFRGPSMFLLERGIIDKQDQVKFTPTLAQIKKSAEIPLHLQNHLMVINAHKVGGNSSVSIHDMPTCYDLVIVDEAHHYPAPTWKELIDHFPNSRRLFLTATPLHRGRPILSNRPPCYELTKDRAIKNGITRPVDFFEGPFRFEFSSSPSLTIAVEIMKRLKEHDDLDPQPKHRHQAMVITKTIEEAEEFCTMYSIYKSIVRASDDQDGFETYHGESEKSVLRRFDAGEVRGLVIVGKLFEGYDNKRVSVVGIARNIQPSSTVLFAQFVGRAVRKLHPKDPVTALVISHPQYNQRENYEQFDHVREGDDVEQNED